MKKKNRKEGEGRGEKEIGNSESKKLIGREDFTEL